MNLPTAYRKNWVNSATYQQPSQFPGERNPSSVWVSTSTMLTGGRPSPRINDETSKRTVVTPLLCACDWLQVGMS